LWRGIVALNRHREETDLTQKIWIPTSILPAQSCDESQQSPNRLLATGEAPAAVQLDQMPTSASSSTTVSMRSIARYAIRTAVTDGEGRSPRCQPHLRRSGWARVGLEQQDRRDPADTPGCRERRG
jgi:hypothetical protein